MPNIKVHYVNFLVSMAMAMEFPMRREPEQLKCMNVKMNVNVSCGFVIFIHAISKNNGGGHYLYNNFLTNHLIIPSYDSRDKRSHFIPQEFIFLKVSMPWLTNYK